MYRNECMEGLRTNGLTSYTPGRPVGDLAVAPLATALRHFERVDLLEVGSRTDCSVGLFGYRGRFPRLCCTRNGSRRTEHLHCSGQQVSSKEADFSLNTRKGRGNFPGGQLSLEQSTPCMQVSRTVQRELLCPHRTHQSWVSHTRLVWIRVFLRPPSRHAHITALEKGRDQRQGPRPTERNFQRPPRIHTASATEPRASNSA